MSLHDPKAINVAIVGVGNCASSLVQGIAHYQNGGANEQIGLMHWDLGGYRPRDIKVVIASDEKWAKRFEEAGLPIIGDDIKAQLGATIVHRVLTDLFHKRGVKLDRTYQLNTGGNTDFLNMANRNRLKSKKISKTE